MEAWSEDDMIHPIHSVFCITSKPYYVFLYRQDKVASMWAGSIIQFCWRFFTVTSRVTTLSFFSLAFPEYLPLILLGHVLFATFFTAFTQRTDFCGAEQDDCLCLEAAFHVLVGIIHIFVPFNIAEGRTRFRYLCCYALELAEDIALALLL